MERVKTYLYIKDMMLPKFQRQHYLYWCNVYLLSHIRQRVVGHHLLSTSAKVT